MGKSKHSTPSPADMTVRMTTAEATVGALIAHGIDTVYALPGVHNDPLFDALFSVPSTVTSPANERAFERIGKFCRRFGPTAVSPG